MRSRSRGRCGWFRLPAAVVATTVPPLLLPPRGARAPGEMRASRATWSAASAIRPALQVFALALALLGPRLLPADDELDSSGPTASFRAAHGEFGERVRRFTPMIDASLAYLADAEVRHEEGDFDLFHFDLDALVPIPVSRDTFLLAGAHAGGRHYDFDDVESANDDLLYNFGLHLGLGHFFTDDFVVQGYWRPSIFSDLDTSEGSLNSDDWKLWYANVLAVYRWRENVFWKLGVAFTDAINTGAIPLAGVAWEFAPRWRLDILAPQLAEISYRPVPDWIVHSGLRIEGEEYHIRLNDAAGNRQKDVRVQEVRYFVGVIHRITDHLSASLELGTTVAGNYEYSSHFDGTLEPAFHAAAGLGWSF